MMFKVVHWFKIVELLKIILIIDKQFYEFNINMFTVQWYSSLLYSLLTSLYFSFRNVSFFIFAEYPIPDCILSACNTVTYYYYY